MSIRDEERTPIVTAFLRSGEKIALVKRSEDVKTYQRKWAAFSGYVEQLPLSQALVELKEEAGLGEDQVKLEGIGIPMRVDDGDLHWLVFPFLFELKPDIEIHTNWEASDLRWVTAEEVHTLDTVPELGKALDSVWPMIGSREFWSTLAEVATNRREGATELARRALRALGAYTEANWQRINTDTLYRLIQAVAASRPSMGVFPDLAAHLLVGIESAGGQYAFDALICELLNSVDDSMTLSIGYALEAIKDVKRLFTLSYSESTRRTIEAWHAEDRVVLVAESAPGKEGLYMAEYLREQGVHIEIVEDTDIERAVRTADGVLVGCDSITADDRIQNKVHTNNAVMTAQAAGIPSFTIAQTFKVTPPGWPIFLERQTEPVLEQTPGSAWVQVFDLTPYSAFTKVLSDEGVLTIERVGEIRNLLGSVGLVSAE